MKNGGLILWNVLPFCETFKNSCLMEKHHTRNVLENHPKDQSFRLSITLSLRKTSQESINLERKSYLEYSSETLCKRGGFGRVTYWLQTLRSWRRWTHQNSTLKDSRQRKISQRKWKIHIPSRRWTNHTFRKRSGIENIHFDTASDQYKEKVT